MSQRCQHSGHYGQCTHASVDGSEFCVKHGNESDRIRGYRISDPSLKARLDHYSADPESVETIRQEVSLYRAMIEERMSFARNEADKIVAFPIVTSAITALHKLVESLVKLDKQADLVLGREALEKFGIDIVQVITEELVNVEGSDAIIDRIAPRIAEAFSNCRNKE